MRKVKHQGREKTCFVPLCRSGYRSNPEKVSMFAVPSDPVRLLEWERLIRREDRKLTPTCVICERHFEDSHVERTFKVTVDGIVNELARERPRLKPDAVPTVFDNYPRHLLPKKTSKRKVRNLCDQTPAKRQKCDAGADVRNASPSTLDNVSVEPPTTVQPSGNSFLQQQPSCVEAKHPFDALSIPATWVKLCEAPAGSVAYARYRAEKNNFCALYIEQMVTFGSVMPERSSVIATVYLRGNERSKHVLTTRLEAEELIKQTALEVLCGGCGLKPDGGKYTTFMGLYFAEKCRLTAESEGESCAQCKYLRRLAQNRLRRKRIKKQARIKTNKSHNISRALNRAKKSLAGVQQQVAQMKAQNEALSESAVEAKMKRLPQKQQLAVRTCFRAAQRRSLKGMPYDDNWIIECVMMRMRSPKLYEHLRRESIFVLPGRSCLQKYLQRFKGGFGLNQNIFSALKEKTKGMDTFSRHGGLLIDEIKLSEHPFSLKYFIRA